MWSLSELDIYYWLTRNSYRKNLIFIWEIYRKNYFGATLHSSFVESRFGGSGVAGIEKGKEFWKFRNPPRSYRVLNGFLIQNAGQLEL